MKPNPRDESEVFTQLEALCTSPGYIHAIAFFCFRDNTVGYAKQMKVENLLKQYSPEHLVRSEISTLIGLACKSEFDIRLPRPEITQMHIDETEKLLDELHHSLLQPTLKLLSKSMSNPFATGSALREPIFYGGEAAYSFQYRDLLLEKYKDDNAWFIANKGYSIQQATTIVSAISRVQNQKINEFIPSIMNKHPEEWTSLPVYTFTADEVATQANEDKSVVESFITSFIAPKSLDKSQFKALSDFNYLNAYPIIQVAKNEYLLFQNYSLMEALYETPFFWLIEDKSYKDIALKNRGGFTEKFSKDNLKKVFGENRVFSNINIYDKKNIVGEIDVLVVFSNRAIVLQAKSKKLTIEARKGNDNCLKDDFKKAVQDAYDQAFLSATFLNDKNYILVDSDGSTLDINREYKEIYPFCVVSEHYPSLSFQTRHFLKYQTAKSIMPPFVMDIFFLDVLCEMLQSPLRFFSYINRRVMYGDKILSGHELTILSYHLKNNLWVDNENAMAIFDDDIGVDLDLAMMARRDNVPGKMTPSGILTKYQNTFFGRLISQIDQRDNPGIIDLGFLLLELDGKTIEQLNKGVSKLIKLSKRDGKHHDLTLGIRDGSTGITIHCNSDNTSIALENLREHCLRRKYVEKAKSWFGMCINPADSQVKFGLSFDFEWIQSEEMDKKVSNILRKTS
ncbi:MAG: nuclease-related domain-containing protein [Anaerolineales bacterium]